jgi:aryl-alcohol dehydrogenase-like predicted oxidoreductase
MKRDRFGNTDLMVSAIGLGCYGMSGAYGAGDDAESIATIRRALDIGVNLLDTSASYGQGHNHRHAAAFLMPRRSGHSLAEGRRGWPIPQPYGLRQARVLRHATMDGGTGK